MNAPYVLEYDPIPQIGDEAARCGFANTLMFSVLFSALRCVHVKCGWYLSNQGWKVASPVDQLKGSSSTLTLQIHFVIHDLLPEAARCVAPWFFWRET